MISFPGAKINIGLDIIDKRNDGFHNLSTCFYPVPLHDVLEFVESDRFSFNTSGLDLPGDRGDNLVIRAYELLKKDFNLPDIAVHLHKNIPAGAGLGGGSSDAASMILMLNDHFQLFLDKSLLVEYAEMLGSDCPFFIYNRPMSATGRGENLVALDLNLRGFKLAIIMPNINISTREAFGKITPLIPERSIPEVLAEYPVHQWKGLLKNDFDPVIFKQFPVLKEIRDTLYGHGAVFASMTGSGAAIYGLFESDKPFNNPYEGNFFYWEYKF